MFHQINRFLKYYFPESIIRKYGLRVFPFIISTIVFYLIQNILMKILKDYAKTMRIKFNFPIFWFTPNAELLTTYFDFSVLTFMNEIYVGLGYHRLPEYNPQEDWVIVDAGANVGLYSLFVSSSKPRLVVALEPDPRNFKRLQFNLRINRAIKVRALPKALFSTDDYYRFFLSRDSFSSKIINGKVQQWDIITEGLSLSSIICMFNLVNIDMLKLDIEGAEHEIISSSNRVIQNGLIKRTVGEIHGGKQSIDTFLDRMDSLGFEVQFLDRHDGTAVFHARYQRATS